MYSLSDGPALSHGPYLGTVSLCSVVSIVLLSVKACIFTANSQLNAEASISPSRQRLHLKKSWGMPVLFLSSVVFALGHTVVAYRTSCRARRKLLFHRAVDPEAVSLLTLPANLLTKHHLFDFCVCVFVCRFFRVKVSSLVTRKSHVLPFLWFGRSPRLMARSDGSLRHLHPMMESFQ